MIFHSAIDAADLRSLIRAGKIKIAGNKLLRIYGTLKCTSGKRMRKENRIFFRSEKEAMENGFRPCGHCMRSKYIAWKNKAFN